MTHDPVYTRDMTVSKKPTTDMDVCFVLEELLKRMGLEFIKIGKYVDDGKIKEWQITRRVVTKTPRPNDEEWGDI